MDSIKTPMKGMNDFLPEETELRENVLDIIKKTYRQFGYTQIETPCLERIENLTGSHGGENEKLIFKILKRGAKLNFNDHSQTNPSEIDMVDCGLRYDLTVPLCRYFSNNFENLFLPFKSLQIGNVWRAEKPQKGRFRQFVQCDIDVIGDETLLAEVDLISAAISTLNQLGFENFKIKINDRRVLKSLINFSEIDNNIFDDVCIILDKLNKIGIEKVKQELIKLTGEEEKISMLLSFFENSDKNLGFCRDFSKGKLANILDADVAENIDKIISCISNNSGNFSVGFDPTLVRGMGYYTGTIFEIITDEAEFSIAGGGRYDDMIGKFLNKKMSIPSCGISIGFERIIQILKCKKNADFQKKVNKIAYLLDKNIDTNTLLKVYSDAEKQRKDNDWVLITTKKKNVAHQKEMLKNLGYTKFF